MTEAFLQYIWQYQLLEGSLVTTDGLLVRVVHAGMLNRDAGPDFFNASVEIGGILWVGNVEIHVSAASWMQHGHDTDPMYNNVVLHVVYDANAKAYTADGRELATVCLKPFIADALWNNYEALVNPPSPIEVPCADKLSQIPAFRTNAYLDRLVVERIERKTADVRRLLADAHGGWELCCYWMMARYFGGKANAFPFELLAKATDMRLIARWRDNPQRIEALLMGQAGMLEGYFADDYPRQLQADYQALRSGAGLQPISGHLWKYARLRPANFPTLRISQFAQLLAQSSGLFSKLLEATSVSQLEQYFEVHSSAYWETHYHFDKPATTRHKSVGRMMAHSIIINAWVPILFEYGNSHGDEACKERAVDLLRQIMPERNRIVDIWKRAGIVPHDAAQSQALIQLYNEYCQHRFCLQCQFGSCFIRMQ